MLWDETQSQSVANALGTLMNVNPVAYIYRNYMDAQNAMTYMWQ